MTVYLLWTYHGDGRVIDGKSLTGIYATRDAADEESRRIGHRSGPRDVEEYEPLTEPRTPPPCSECGAPQ